MQLGLLSPHYQIHNTALVSDLLSHYSVYLHDALLNAHSTTWANLTNKTARRPGTRLTLPMGQVRPCGAVSGPTARLSGIGLCLVDRLWFPFGHHSIYRVSYPSDITW